MPKENKFIFLDTETTDLDEQCRMIQVAYKTSDGVAGDGMFKPPIKISYEAMGVHHITEKMLEGKEPFFGSEMHEALSKLLRSHILVAHNAKFDIGVLEREKMKVPHHICTKKIAMRLWPKLASHKMQFLRYQLGIEISTEQDAHDARADIAVLEPLFEIEMATMRRQLPDADPETIIEIMEEISMQPVLLYAARFGKHKGKSFEQIKFEDPGYLRWLSSQDIDEDLRFTIDHWIGSPRNEVIDCYVCDGTGTKKEGPGLCEHCDGAGTVDPKKAKEETEVSTPEE